MTPNPFARATVSQLLDVVAARHGAREAIVCGDARLTFTELRDRVGAFAGGLAALGLGRGDALAIWLPNRPQWFVAQYAAARLGIVVVALNPRYRAHELSYILAQSNATALLLTDRLGTVDYFDTIEEVLPELADAVPGELASPRFPKLRHVIVDSEDVFPGCHRASDLMDGPEPATVSNRPMVVAGAASPGRVVVAGSASPPHTAGGPVRDARGSDAPDHHALFTILYTSGTTSFPKGAMITHANCVPHGWSCGETLRLTPADRVLHALPAAGTWGGVNIPLTAWSHGACLVLMESFDPLHALYLIERERCTVLNAVDNMLIPMLDHPELGHRDVSSLRTGGVAAVGGGRHGLLEDVLDRLVPLAFHPYGMTEVNAMSLLHSLDEPAAERLVPGVWPAPGLEARIAHPDTGAPAGVDVEGELQFRGPLVTPGYYDKPDETKAAFTTDGWFKTGDLGVQDDRGRTIFRGRLKETLRISHHMVAPGEIEAFLGAHPAIAQAFVVGIPDSKTNEAPVAYVIRKTGAQLTEDELRGWCYGRIASFKIPRGVRFVDDVPRTPSPHGDKVQRVKLREMAREDFAP